MDLTVAGIGLVAGVAATAAMTATEVAAWRRWGLPAVLEWQENQALAARLLRRPIAPLLLSSFGFHFLHGALAGLVFAVGVAWLSIAAPLPALGAAFGLAMWGITLVIHEPITGARPYAGPLGSTAVAVSLVGHVVYGAALGLALGVL